MVFSVATESQCSQPHPVTSPLTRTIGVSPADQRGKVTLRARTGRHGLDVLPIHQIPRWHLRVAPITASAVLEMPVASSPPDCPRRQQNEPQRFEPS